MKTSIAGRMSAVLLAAALGACATGGDAPDDSGFLTDYSSLQQTKDSQGKTIRASVSPKLTPANYHAILLDPLVFHPEPRPSEQVSAQTLEQILAYSNEALRRSVGQQFKVVDRVGPGVLRVRGAISSVAAQREGLKPYQYLPIALVATMAKRASKGAPQRAFIVIEVEGTDSVTGELLAQRVRVATGERLAGVVDQKVIALETVKPLLDELAAGAFPELSKYVQTR